MRTSMFRWLFPAMLGQAIWGCADLDSVPEATEEATTPYDWLQFNGNPQHDGNNRLEQTLAPGNVGGLTRRFQVTLPSFVDNAPVLLTAVPTSGGTRDLLFVTTRAGDVIALDAPSGATVWQKAHGPGSCHINNGSSVCYTTSAPAIDPGRQFVYSYGLDGFVHKHQVADGAEVTGGGWPELASTKPFDEKSSPALGFATAASGTTYLYVSNGGYPGDGGDYQGHVTAINLADGTQRVFNTVCSDQTVHFLERPGTPDCADVQSAVWARSGVVYDAANDRIFFVTGNARYAPASHAWGDTILAAHPDGTGSGGNPIDAYTPTNFQSLQNSDADLGSTAPLILPAVPGSSISRLGLQGGKDAQLRLVNLDNLSGQGGPGHTGGEIGALVGVPQGGQVLTAPAAWTRPSDGSVWVFVGNDSGLSALRVTAGSGGAPALTPVWQHTGKRTSPLVANGVLYAAGNNIIQALDPVTGTQLWSDTQIGSLHWASPMVANGVLYIADTSARVTAYALPTTLPAPWTQGDIGSVGIAGSGGASGGVFTVTGSGNDIWGTSDAFHYVYQSLSGDGTIVARVASVQNTDPWAKAGVMIRETTDAGSRYAIMAITPGNGAAFQRRTATGGSATHTAGPSVTAPYWVRLVRSGNTLTGSVSADGVTWTAVGSDTVTMAGGVLVGLAVTAHNNAVASTSTFDNVSVTVTSARPAVKINFQLATTATPAGYLGDSGAPFADRGNGWSYGWNADNSVNARERNAANLPDKRFDTLIHMQKASDPNAVWEIAVPNGSYSVHLVAGDPSFVDSVFQIDVEGVRVVSGTPSSATHWIEGTQTVTVADGRLTVTNGSGSANDKVAFIEIAGQ